MGITKKQNVINPEVMADMIEAKISALAKFTPYAKVDTSLVGVPGDKVTVPSWNYIGDAVDVAEGEEVDLTSLTASTTQFTVKKAMKSVAITEEARLSGYGDPIGAAESQLSKSMFSKCDSDLVEAAYESRNIYDGSAGIIGYKPIVSAVGIFNDEEETEKVMFVHPEQETQMLKDDNFISADKFESGVAVKGSIGKTAGCWIKKSRKVKKVDAVSAVTAVAGVYKYAISTKAAANDRLKIGNVELVAGSSDWSLSTDTATGNATALAAALNASADASVKNYTWSTSGATLIATEDAGYEGTLGKAPIVVTQAVSGTLVVSDATTNDTAGVKKVDAVPALYLCPIIKCEPDDPETDETEEEAPALTLYLKKDTQVDADWKPRKQLHEITAAKYYGAALTNESKVVIAKFAQVATE